MKQDLGVHSSLEDTKKKRIRLEVDPVNEMNIYNPYSLRIFFLPLRDLRTLGPPISKSYCVGLPSVTIPL